MPAAFVDDFASGDEAILPLTPDTILRAAGIFSAHHAISLTGMMASTKLRNDAEPIITPLSNRQLPLNERFTRFH